MRSVLQSQTDMYQYKVVCEIKFILLLYIYIGEQADGKGRSHFHQAFLQLKPQQRNEHLEAKEENGEASSDILYG